MSVYACLSLTVCGPTHPRSRPTFTPTQLGGTPKHTCPPPPSAGRVGVRTQMDWTGLLTSLLSRSTTATSSHLLLPSCSLRERRPPTHPCLRTTRASSPPSIQASHRLRGQPRRGEASCCPPPLPASTARPTALSRSLRPTPAEPSARLARCNDLDGSVQADL